MNAELDASLEALMVEAGALRNLAMGLALLHHRSPLEGAASLQGQVAKAAAFLLKDDKGSLTPSERDALGALAAGAVVDAAPCFLVCVEAERRCFRATNWTPNPNGTQPIYLGDAIGMTRRDAIALALGVALGRLAAWPAVYPESSRELPPALRRLFFCVEGTDEPTKPAPAALPEQSPADHPLPPS